MVFRLVPVFIITIFTALPVSAQALTFKGDFTQGGLIIGKAEPQEKLTLDGLPVPIDPDGTFALGFGRDAKSTAELAITDANGTKTTKILTIKKRDWPVQHINGLPKAKVTPPPSVYAKIKSDIRAIRTVRQHWSPRAHFEDGFMCPVKGIVSGVFGSQRVLNGKPKSPHSGLDIAAPKGTPIYAAADGVVSLAVPDMYYTGQSVMIDHGLGLQTIYVHMSRFFVKVGDKVKQGQKIGEVGATGRATGPHLHWGLSWFNRRLDPAAALKAFPAHSKAP